MIPFRKILVPTDFSNNSLAGLRYAEAFAARFGGEILLTHVVVPPTYPAATFARSSAASAAVEELLEASGKRLDDLKSRETGRTVEVHSVLREGVPAHELVLAAEQEGADLLITATHGHSGVKHMLLGSTAEKVVRSCRCPVLTVRPDEPGGVPSVEFERVLVATDFSDHAAVALPYARELAEISQATALVTHVMEPPVFPGMPFAGASMAVVIEEIEAAASEQLSKVVETHFRGVDARAVLCQGRSYAELIEVAKREKADLIVLATHGYAGLTHFLVGSTAERVVRHAPCPVLTVRATEPE